MRHNLFGKKLNRNIKQRKALFKSLINALIDKEKIRTTLAKARAVSGLAEKLVTLSKNGNSGSLRQLSSILVRRSILKKFTDEIVPRFKGRIGGYTHIKRLGFRLGDQAEEVILEWSVNKKETERTEKKETQKLSNQVNTKTVSKKR